MLPGLSSSSGIEPLGRIDVVDASPRALVLLLDPKVVVEVASSDPLTGPGQGRTLVDLTLTRGRGVPVEALQTGVFDDLSVFDELLVRDAVARIFGVVRVTKWTSRSCIRGPTVRGCAP